MYYSEINAHSVGWGNLKKTTTVNPCASDDQAVPSNSIRKSGGFGDGIHNALKDRDLVHRDYKFYIILQDSNTD